MIEITLNTNFPQVITEMRQTVVDKILTNNHPILITAASGVLALVAYRIHSEGLRANGSAIGRYDPGYLKVRQKKKYNRTSDPTMVFSLTRQMENDFTVIAEEGVVGLGFKNSYNFKTKAVNLEASHPGTYALSDSEEQVVVDIINEYIDGLFT